MDNDLNKLLVVVHLLLILDETLGYTIFPQIKAQGNKAAN